MLSLLQKHAEQGFADFRGLHISGTVPVKQELINELIANFLQSPPPGAASPSGFDVRLLLPLVKNAEVTADSGVLTLRFEIRA